MADKKVLMVWGGWDGHEPKQTTDVFADVLDGEGYEVIVSDTMDSYKDADLMQSVDLVVPCWTMGTIDGEQNKGLMQAIEGGVGLGGWHGGGRRGHRRQGRGAIPLGCVVAAAGRAKPGRTWRGVGSGAADPNVAAPAHSRSSRV